MRDRRASTLRPVAHAMRSYKGHARDGHAGCGHAPDQHTREEHTWIAELEGVWRAPACC